MILLVVPLARVSSTKMHENNSSMVVEVVTYSVDFSTPSMKCSVQFNKLACCKNTEITNSQLSHLLTNSTIVCRTCQLHEWCWLASLLTFSSQGIVLGNVVIPIAGHYSMFTHCCLKLIFKTVPLSPQGDVSIQ